VNDPAVRPGPGPSPYVGLRAFRVADRDRFFGRTQESHEVAALWRANKLTILYGASGVGKTSLLQAGVIPLLDAERMDILPVGRVSAAGLSQDLLSTGPYTLALLSSLAPDRDPAELAGLSLPRFLSRRPKKKDRYGDTVPILLAIDQAEELLGDLSYRPEAVRKFIAMLARVLRNNRETRLLMAVREDRLPAALAYERILAGRSHSRSRLLPFGEATALEAIRSPLKRTGRRFGRGVASSLVRELRTIRVSNQMGETTSLMVDTVDPVQVQVVCSALWDSLPAQATVITSTHVRRFGDIDRFLASFCSKTLSAVATEHDVPIARIRSWLQQTFITELGTRGTAYEGIDSTAGMPNTVVRSLEDRHIIKAEHRAGIRWYELQHDRLIEPLQQAHPLELIEAAEMELSDGGLNLAERHAEQAIRTCGIDDLMIRARGEQVLGHIARQRNLPALALRRYRTAASLFEVLEDSASVARMLAASGSLSMVIGQYSDAETDLRAAAGRAPLDLSVQYLLARAFWHVGRSVPAVAVLSGLLDIDRDMVSALRLRGEILAELGEAKAALRDLDRVREGQQPSTVAARALALAMLGRLEAADQEAADAAANAWGSGPVLLYAARVRVLTGEPSLAVELASRAMRAENPPLPPHLREQAELIVDSRGYQVIR
jgi:tetratricopeptide (TPR) repeat protein